MSSTASEKNVPTKYFPLFGLEKGASPSLFFSYHFKNILKLPQPPVPIVSC